MLTGLNLAGSVSDQGVQQQGQDRQSQQAAATSFANTGRSRGGTVRFTFTVYENQRRWLGLGWTSSMFAYERAAWTDEHLNPAPPKEKFQLPEVEGGNAKWQWVPGSEWRTDGSGRAGEGTSGKPKSDGWIYYDTKVCTIFTRTRLCLL